MPKLTHKQVIVAHNALFQLAELDNVPAIPTGMAIRRGVRLLASIAEDVEKERKKIIDKWLERDGQGNKVPDETNPDGSPKNWKFKDKAAAQGEADELYSAEAEVAWSIPVAFFAGINLKPSLLIDLGDLLVDEPPNGKSG